MGEGSLRSWAIIRRILGWLDFFSIGETNFLTGRVEADKVRLSSGDQLEAETTGHAGEVTLTVRPEQVRICDEGEAGSLSASIDSTVYFGTDTHCHLQLSDGTKIVARLQSPPSGEIGLARGEKVGIKFADGAVQVLDA